MKKSGLFFIKKIFSSKLFLLAIFVLAIFLVLAAGKAFLKRYQVDKEIKKLETEISKLGESNRQLSDLLQYLNTDFFAEREARLKLGLQKPGEKVVVIPDKGSSMANSSEKEYNKKELSNPQKWWRYFFNL